MPTTLTRSRSGDRDRALGTVAHRFPCRALELGRHVSLDHDGVTLVVQVEHLRADGPAACVSLTAVVVDGHPHGVAADFASIEAGSAGGEAWTRGPVSIVGFCWAPSGRGADHLPAPHTVR